MSSHREEFGHRPLISTNQSTYNPQLNSLLQFQFSADAKLDPVPVSKTAIAFPYPGGVPSISSNGNTNGIVWIQEALTNQVVLHAYDATNLANELYSSAAVYFGRPTSFAPPTVCNGKVFVGTMNSVGVFGVLPTPGSSIAKDFNGDGYADLVFENTATGARVIWLLKNGVYLSSIGLPTASPNWQIAGVGDFLGNGQSDLVLENTVTGEHVIWILNNGVLQYGIELPSISPGWHVAGAGDFNGDGFADLVWENTTTGGRVIWLLVNGTYSSSISLPTLSPSWHISGVGDFLGNGQSDLVWENTVSGHHDIWILNNGVLQYGIGLPAAVSRLASCGCRRFQWRRSSGSRFGKYSQRPTCDLAAQQRRLLFQYRSSHSFDAVGHRRPLGALAHSCSRRWSASNARLTHRRKPAKPGKLAPI